MSNADVVRWTAIGLHTIVLVLGLAISYGSLDFAIFGAGNVLGVILLRTSLFTTVRGVCILIGYEMVLTVASAIFLLPDFSPVPGFIVLSLIYVAWLRSKRPIAINVYAIVALRCLATIALAHLAIMLAVASEGVLAIYLPVRGVSREMIMWQFRVADLLCLCVFAVLVSFPVRHVFPRNPAYWALGCFLVVFIMVNIPVLLGSPEELESLFSFDLKVLSIFVLGVPGIIWLTGRSSNAQTNSQR